MKESEIKHIDRRYESYRIKDKRQEKEILSSVIENGIKEPVRCVEKPGGGLIILDGFKRLRSARKAGIEMMPVESLGSDEIEGIFKLLRLSNDKCLNIIEQAGMVDKLNHEHGLGVREIAIQIERSPAWVSVRLGIIGEMSDEIRKMVFEGKFPVRSYMYTIRPFTRVNSNAKADADKFVEAVSGKGLSIHDIKMLAEGYFKGSDKLKKQILKGNLDWTLERLKPQMKTNKSLSELESRVLKDLEIAHRYVGKLPYEIMDPRLKNEVFFMEAETLAQGILGKIEYFEKKMEEFYDNRRGQEEGSTKVVCGGEKEEGDSPAV